MRLAIALLLLAQAANAQTIFGKNLIVNGDAEQGPGATSWSATVSSIPGWTKSGAPNVVTWASGAGLSLTTPGPVSHGANYFGGGSGSATSTLTQKIDLSAGATAIDAGGVTYDVSGYLGGTSGDSAQMIVTFQNAGGTAVVTVKLTTPKAADGTVRDGVYFVRQIGPIPAGTRSANVELDMLRSSGSANDGAADNLSLVLNTNTTATALFGPNLIVNGNAELPSGETASVGPLDVPGWARTPEFTVERYDHDGDLGPTDPGPADRGTNYFFGGNGNVQSSATQDIDVSAAATPIDANQVTFNFTGWIGGYSSQNDSITAVAEFRNWTGTVLGSAQLGPVLAPERNNTSELLSKSQSGAVPAGTRYVRITMTAKRTDGSDDDGLADSLSLTMTGPVPPGTPNITNVITAGGFGGYASAAPGSWIEVYGTSLAPDTRQWAGSDFNGTAAPTSLDGTVVTIGGQKAFVSYISPTQVNVQVPSNVATGTQQVMVTAGSTNSATFPLTILPSDPGLLAPSSFLLNGKQYVVALHTDGAFVLPPGAIAGLNTRQAQPGETILMYGIGFGTVTPNMTAGQIVTAQNQLTAPVQILFNGTPAQLGYDGLAPNFVGLYQFNVTVPGSTADNDALPLSYTLGGTPGAQTLYIAVKR